MKRAALILIIILALLVATLPLWYSSPGGKVVRISGKLRDVGGRTIVVATDSGDVVVELRGDYAGGLKWHQVLDKLRACLGEEIRVEAEYRGNSLVAIALELPSRGIKF